MYGRSSELVYFIHQLRTDRRTLRFDVDRSALEPNGLFIRPSLGTTLRRRLFKPV